MLDLLPVKDSFRINLGLTSLCLCGDLHVRSTKLNGVIFYNYFYIIYLSSIYCQNNIK